MNHDFLVFLSGVFSASVGWIYLAYQLDARWREHCLKILRDWEKSSNWWCNAASRHAEEAYVYGCRGTAENFLRTINDPVARRN